MNENNNSKQLIVLSYPWMEPDDALYLMLMNLKNSKFMVYKLDFIENKIWIKQEGEIICLEIVFLPTRTLGAYITCTKFCENSEFLDFIDAHIPSQEELNEMDKLEQEQRLTYK